MASAENTYLGFAKQSAKGNPHVTDANFKYLLFRQAQVGPAPVYLPLDQEAGGGAMLRNVIKAGVVTGGQIDLIPRPDTLGDMFLAITGSVNSVDGADGSYEHTFTVPTDQFTSPWYTFRHAPGNLIGEQLADMKMSAFSLAWRAANFVSATLGIQGAAAPAKISTGSWNAAAQVDGGPQFISPKGTIELPTGTTALVTSGAFSSQLAMPLDEQWVVGSYSPNNMQITQRSYVLSLMLKIEDSTIYNKIMYDPNAGSTWLPDVFREANINVNFQSDALAAPGKPYEFGISANGETGADANVVWSCQPVDLRAGRQVQLAVTGTFLANPVAGSPLTLSLVNQTESY